jgi:hypothetical protein
MILRVIINIFKEIMANFQIDNYQYFEVTYLKGYKLLSLSHIFKTVFIGYGLKTGAQFQLVAPFL